MERLGSTDAEAERIAEEEARSRRSLQHSETFAGVAALLQLPASSGWRKLHVLSNGSRTGQLTMCIEPCQADVCMW